MRKWHIMTVLGLLILAQAVFAQTETTENPPKIKRFSVEWSFIGFNTQPVVFGRLGHLGFSFLVFNNDKLNIRNHILWYTGVLTMEKTGEKFNGYLLIDKISVGALSYNGLFRYYTFLDGGAGPWGTKPLETFEAETFDNPWLGTVGIGIGLDVFPARWLSFFTEMGLRGIVYEGEFYPQHRFELGARVHF
jgi:hypothetical protein